MTKMRLAEWRSEFIVIEVISGTKSDRFSGTNGPFCRLKCYCTDAAVESR